MTEEDGEKFEITLNEDDDDDDESGDLSDEDGDDDASGAEEKAEGNDSDKSLDEGKFNNVYVQTLILFMEMSISATLFMDIACTSSG